MLKIELRHPQQLSRLAIIVVMATLSIYLIVLIGFQLQSTKATSSVVARVGSGVVVGWDWFGRQRVIAPVQTQTELANAQINADLLGVMLSGDASLATLKFNGKPEQVYQKGDKLNGKMELIDIEAYRIVISDNGINKQLLMKKPDVIMESQQQDENVDVQSQGFALANMFGAVPVNIGGDTGFKINNLSADVAGMADIRDGDVVVQIDGLSVQDLMSDPVKWMSYSNSSSLPVTLVRNGREEIIYVNAASLSAKILPTLGLKP
ncbi:MAG: type II secretory pathway component PulC [Porticoccaceae bacterium]|jgi:type II secretory pathway component PulC